MSITTSDNPKVERSPWLPVLYLSTLWLFGGCATSGPAEPEPLPEPVYPFQQPIANGSLFNPNRGSGLFSDQRARNVGDVLTILLEEQTTARKSASTSTGKSQTISLAAPSLFGRVPTTDSLSAEVSGARDFEGSGDSQQSNQLQGQLSVRVIEVLPGGTLSVAGEKRLRLNQGTEYLRVTGLVRPQDIAADNTVPSSRVADANIAYSGRGAVADANTQGWLARFFSSPLWPF